MGRLRTVVLLTFLLLPSCTFLGLTDEPEPAPSPTTAQPVAAPAARRIDPNTAILKLDDLGGGWKVEPPDPADTAQADELTDNTNDCGQTVNIPTPQKDATGELFTNEGRFTALVTGASQFAQGQGSGFMKEILEDARKCPKATQGGETFYVWAITSPPLGDEALRFRLIINEARSVPLWMDFIFIRRGDAIAQVAYIVAGHEIDPNFSDTIAQKADARLQGATTAP